MTARKITEVPNTFEGACELVRKHCKRDETPEQAVNRLFRERLKHQGLRGDAPSLTAENTEVITETKSKREFAALDIHCRDGAYDSEGPILIVRYAGGGLAHRRPSSLPCLARIRCRR